MTPHELREIGEKLYGKWGWQTKMAKFLKVNTSTVRRWNSGTVPIKQSVALTLKYLLQEKKITDLLNEPKIK